jgi:elongation factor P
MVAANNLRRGDYVEIDGTIYEVVDYLHHKPGKGPVTVRTKLKNIKLDTVIERSYDPDNKLNQPNVEQKDMQYLYKDGNKYVFMDMQSYEQTSFSEDHLGDSVKFLKENTIIYAVMHEGEPLGIRLPTTVDLKIIDTVPGIRGDTVSGGAKTATLETGFVVRVPLFINTGDVVRVDTRTGEYLERL